MPDELTIWLDGVRAEQAARGALDGLDEKALDQAADLWCLNHDAMQIKDKRPGVMGVLSAADIVHAKIDAVLTAMGL